MFEATVCVENAHGIHCRPSAIILKATQAYSGVITISNEYGEAQLDSMLALMSLGLEHRAHVTIQVEGPDEQDFGAALAELFAFHFDFPPKEEGASNPEAEKKPELEAILKRLEAVVL